MNKRYSQIAVALFCGVALTQASPRDTLHSLSDISVKGEAVSETQQPVTVTTLDSKYIDKLHLQRPEEILNEVPGAEAGNYNQGGVANTFMLRGFSNGGHGGDAAVFVDGITLNEGESHADGYADMNVLIPLEIDHVEIFKGPSSALYGNFARGGVVAFNTKKGGEYNKLRMEYGTFNTLNTQAAFGIKVGENVSNNSAVQYYHTDGYQDNSHWLRGNVSTRFDFKLNEKLDLAVSARAHGSEWGSPGYIPKAQFDNVDESKKQAENAEFDGGSKRFYTERLDLGYSFSDQLKLLYWAYGTQQDFTRFAKFGYEKGGTPGDDFCQSEKNYMRNVFGTGASLNYLGAIGEFPFGVVGGVEYFNESTDFNLWYTENRLRLEHGEDRTYGITTFSGFAQADMEITPYFRPLLGIRVDNFGGELESRDPNTVKVVQDMNDYLAVSPKAGFSSRVIEPLDFRFSYSKGYALPDGEAKYSPAYAVDPVSVNQLETGLEYNFNDVIKSDLSVYMLDTDNEIQEKIPGSNIFENIGKTRRQGLEIGLTAAPIKGLELSGDLGMIKSEIIENSSKELEGKEVSGVPEMIWNIGARYVSPLGLGAGLKFRNVGEYYLDEMNTTTYEGYGVLNGDIFYTFERDNGKSCRLYLAVDNIANEHYSQSVWGGYGTLNYAVSSPRTFTGGIQLDW